MGLDRDGIDRIAWVLALAVFWQYLCRDTSPHGYDGYGNQSAAGQNSAISSRGMVICIILALVLAGSLLGDSVAAATVIGVLIVKSLAELNLDEIHIAAIIIMGAELGSIMPPVTQAVFLSASLVNVDPDAVVNVAYFT